jgi:predicted ATPase/DNA-binding XRE family transcriptional regulator
VFDPYSFGYWVLQRRKALELTREALARQVGCATETIKKIERDERRPSRQIAELLAGALSIPSEQQKLFVQVARGEHSIDRLNLNPTLTTPFPTREQITNLPVPFTSFIGREKEQEEIINLIGKNRLVTLAGAGGIGKTSLAIQAGYKLRNEFPNGIWFIALDSLSDPALVSQTVASLFDIQQAPDRPFTEILTNVLREKTALLILDNCEHLLNGCSQLSLTLLTSCPNLKILATSREVLNITGEAVYYTPSLSFPTGDVLIENLTDYESIRLFSERAALALFSFKLTKENAQAIVEVCRKLDGIPLAIELAAARVNILQATEILNQLQNSFALLSSDNRMVLSRHQTLQASLDWSWDLLSEAEQRFMRQLAVFAGGWTLESAQAICDEDVLNLTGALVKKSLIGVKQEAGRETRYGFHEIIRQYTCEKLIASDENESVRTRHLKYFLRLVESAEPALKGPKQVEWMIRLNDERDNLRAALEWADKTDVEAGLSMSGWLLRFWQDLDFREGERWLSRFLEKPESQAYMHARAKALYTYGIILHETEQNVPLQNIAEECLSLYREIGDQHGEIDGLIVLGRSTWVSQGTSRAKQLFQQALQLSESLGDVWRKAFALGHLGALGPESAFHWKAAIPLARELGDWRLLVDLVGSLGYIEVMNGDIESAQKNLDEALQLSRTSKFKRTMMYIPRALSRIEMIRGNVERARAILEEFIKNTIELGYGDAYLWIHADLGRVIVQQGNIAEARSVFAKTTQRFLENRIMGGVHYSLEGIAGLFVTTEKPRIAARLIGWADAVREKANSARPFLEQSEVDKIIAACIAKMGEAAFSDAYEEGRIMTPDEAVESALSES